MSKQFLFFVLLLLCGLGGTASGDIPQSERDALLALYDSTNGDAWIHRDNWGGDPGTECTWWGVTCNGDETHVTGLLFTVGSSGNNMVGPIPPQLSDLTMLEWMNLGYNNLNGSIPSELGQLTNLEFLILYHTELTGSIPSELSQMTNLVSLRLYLNQLSGNIPTELSQLSNLMELWLYKNQITGEIPTELGQMPVLWDLNLHGNQLSGGIPSELGQAPRLTILNLQENQLSGPIPSELSQCAYMGEIWLQNNQLTGAIPPEFGEFDQLYDLRLSSNQLNGAIPPELGQIASLQSLYLDNNQLSGPIPPELGQLSTLTHLKLQNNRLSGFIPPEIGNMISIRTLMLSGNLFSGEVPLEITNLPSLDQGWNVGGLHLGYNALYTHNPGLLAYLDNMDYAGDFQSRQTVAPADVSWTPAKTDGELTWTPIPFSDHSGRYEIWASTIQGGPYEKLGETADKTEDRFTVTGLEEGQTHYLVVRTVTDPFWGNSNTVISEFSDEVRVGPEEFQVIYQAAHVAADATWWSRITLVYLGVDTSPVTLAAVNEDGELVETFTTEAMNMGEVLDDYVDVFFSDSAFQQGIWVTVVSASPVVGVVSFGTMDNLTQVTIPITITEGGSRELVFPYVISSEVLGYFTGITLVNTQANAATCILEAYSETGELLDRTPVLINGHGKYVRLLEWIFNVPDTSTIRFLRVMADRPLMGFELFGSYADAGMAGLPALIPEPLTKNHSKKVAHRLCYMDIPDTDTYYTGVTVSNMGDAETQLHVTLRDAGGVTLAENDWPAPVAVGEQVTREIWNFLDGTVYPDAAWMEITSPDQLLIGFELFLSTDGIFRFDGVTALESGFQSLAFPLVGPATDWDNLLRITNIGGTETVVFISAFEADGTALGAHQETLSPNSQTVLDVGNIFPGQAVAWMMADTSGGEIIGDLTYVSIDLNRMSSYLGIPPAIFRMPR